MKQIENDHFISTSKVKYQLKSEYWIDILHLAPDKALDIYFE